MSRNTLLFKEMIAKHGNGLSEHGYVDISQFQTDEHFNREGYRYLCEYNNSNIWYLYTIANTYLLIDLKTQYYITGMKIHGTTAYGYRWDVHPPSYALKFSNDKETFMTLFQEQKSKRITDATLETDYCFETNRRFRYFRLRETDFADGKGEHGQYISWLDFYVLKNFSSACDQAFSQLIFSYLLTFSIFFY